MRPILATPLRTANTTRQTAGLLLRLGAKPQTVQKYGKAKQQRIKGGISASQKESTQRKQYLRWVLFESQ